MLLHLNKEFERRDSRGNETKRSEFAFSQFPSGVCAGDFAGIFRQGGVDFYAL